MANLPAFAHPPHLTSPNGHLRAWLTEPLGLLTQVVDADHFSKEDALFIADTCDRALLELLGGTEHPCYFVHDWSAVSTYDAAARPTLVDWGLRVRKRVAQTVLVLRRDIPALTSMAVNLGSVALTAAGMRFDVVHELSPVVEELKLRPHPKA